MPVLFCARSQIKADFLPLSKTKHGRHLVQKLISQAKKEDVPGTGWTWRALQLREPCASV